MTICWIGCAGLMVGCAVGCGTVEVPPPAPQALKISNAGLSSRANDRGLVWNNSTVSHFRWERAFLGKLAGSTSVLAVNLIPRRTFAEERRHVYGCRDLLERARRLIECHSLLRGQLIFTIFRRAPADPQAHHKGACVGTRSARKRLDKYIAWQRYAYAKYDVPSPWSRGIDYFEPC